MLSIRVGLVDTTGTVEPAVMTAAAAALNVQVTRDLPQFWPVTATVAYLPNHRVIPQGVWPVQLVKSLPPGEGGFHMSKHNQPYAKVIATPGSNEWIVDASHETIEMLVDPNGNRLQTSTSIGISNGQVVDTNDRFEYLVEACDPCEADAFTYQIDGLSVSDFITPHYYDPQATAGTRYSFTGAITRPRELLKGGYISFVNPASNELQQILWVDPDKPPQLNDLGPATGLSLRMFVDNHMEELVSTHRTAARKSREIELLHGARKDYRARLLANGERHAVLFP